MSSGEVSNFAVVGLFLRRILSGRVFTALLAVFLVALCHSSSPIFADTVRCHCSKPISKIPMILVHTTRGGENYCCTKCGLSALRGVKAQVEEVWVGDYTTGKLINGKEAYFVEGYFTESPCCEGALIPFEYRQDARKFIFKGGGRIVNLQGKMILEHKPVPFQNKPWIYIAIAAVCSAIFFLIGEGSQGKKTR